MSTMKGAWHKQKCMRSGSQSAQCEKSRCIKFNAFNVQPSCEYNRVSGGAKCNYSFHACGIYIRALTSGSVSSRRQRKMTLYALSRKCLAREGRGGNPQIMKNLIHNCCTLQRFAEQFSSIDRLSRTVVGSKIADSIGSQLPVLLINNLLVRQF